MGLTLRLQHAYRSILSLNEECVFENVHLMVVKMKSGTMKVDNKCEAKSIDFKGMCLKWRNFKQLCISEGFPDGRCKGFMRKCLSRKEAAAAEEEMILKEPCDQELYNILVGYEIYN
ncbi:hypothetical protein YC2023_039972 [Brassica napus]